MIRNQLNPLLSDRYCDEKNHALTNAFDPDHFKEVADLIVSELQKYLSNEEIRGLDLRHPEELTKEVRALMAMDAEGANKFSFEKCRKIVELYIQTGIQVHSTGFMGRQFSGIIPSGGLFDLIGSIVNQPSSFYEAGQFPNVAERIIAEEFNKFIGWDSDKFDMVSTSGGSLANMTAILCARNKRYPDLWSGGYHHLAESGLKPAIAVGANGHYSVTRAAGILGIGDEQIVRLPLSDDQKIDIDQVIPALEKAKDQGLDVFCMVAAAGSTNVGSFDSLSELADIAHERDCWLHVDGAHGGSFLVSDQLRYKLNGINKVDSFIVDAHKMLFVPSPCTLLFYRDKQQSKTAFRQEASYVFNEEPDVYSLFDGAEKNFECTKRPAIMNLWATWTLYGSGLFAEKLNYLYELSQSFYHLLEAQKDFTALHCPEANIICFRYTPYELNSRTLSLLQTAIRDQVKADGEFFISKADVCGVSALRVVFMNHKIEMKHCEMLLDKIRTIGDRVLAVQLSQ